MMIMNKNNFLVICVIVLFALNACTLFIVFRSREGNERMSREGGPPRDYIITQLKLDAEQQRKFEEMRRQHHELAMHIQHEEERLHDLYFSLLKTDNPDMNKVDS